MSATATGRHHLGSWQTNSALIAIAMAAGALAVWSQNLGIVELVGGVVLGGCLGALAVIDGRAFRLPDRITLPLVALGAAFSLRGDTAAVVEHAGGAAAGYFALFTVAWLYERWRGIAGLGLGDAKLFAAGGAWVGIYLLPMVLLIASALALMVVAAARAAGAEFDRGTRVAFGPFLACAIWVVWCGKLAGWMT